MTDMAIRTKHQCPECENYVHMVLTRLSRTIYHPDHGTLHVAEGVELDEADSLWQFCNENEQNPEHVCFVCGWCA